jgi:flagellar basal body rod protein FlgG
MEALTREFHAIAHNLANVNTVGYKRLLTAFMGGNAPGAAEGPGTATAVLGAGGTAPGSASAVVGKTLIDMTQGTLAPTDRPLDLALHGPGFFVLETPQGDVYTRNGTFQVSATGQLVDSSGRTVAGASGPIIVPQGTSSQAVSVSNDGRVSVGDASIGQLRVVEFEKPEALLPAGQCGLKAPRGVDPTPATHTLVQQGFQETSNVSVVNELVGLITVSRLYEANVRSVQMRGERFKSIIQVALG